MLLHIAGLWALNEFRAVPGEDSFIEFQAVQISFLTAENSETAAAESQVMETPEAPEPENIVTEKVVAENALTENTLTENTITEPVSEVVAEPSLEFTEAPVETVAAVETEETVRNVPSAESSQGADAAAGVAGAEASVPMGDSYSDLEAVSLSDARTPAPSYPAKARQMNWEGDVSVYFTVDSKGRPESIEIRVSSGYDILDQAVLDTVRKRWRFSRENAGMKLKKTFSFRLV
ncbi:MAG: energy transducer TonB [Spirochaetales bacterium]|nr:energy transducer TonB [Spirochaetales bacterium]